MTKQEYSDNEIRSIPALSLKEVPEWLQDYSVGFYEGAKLHARKANSVFRLMTKEKDKKKWLKLYSRLNSHIMTTDFNVTNLEMLYEVIFPVSVIGIKEWVYADSTKKPKNQRIKLRNYITRCILLIELETTPDHVKTQAKAHLLAMFDEVNALKVA